MPYTFIKSSSTPRTRRGDNRLLSVGVSIIPEHPWSGRDVRKDDIHPWATFYEAGTDTVVEKSTVYDYPIYVPAGTYDIELMTAPFHQIKHTGITVSSNITLELDLGEPYNVVYVNCYDYAEWYETGNKVYLDNALVDPTGWIPDSGHTPDARFDWGYGGYDRDIPVTVSLSGYESASYTEETHDWTHGEIELEVGLKPEGWEPPPPEYDHQYVETYKTYEIHFFPEPNVYGVYLYPGESPPSGPVPLDDDWQTYSSVEGCRGFIDNLVGEPVYVETYPPVTPTHVDPGWDIYQEPGGSQRYYAIDNSTGETVGTYWPSDNLSGLKQWLDETYVPTGYVADHTGQDGITYKIYFELIGGPNNNLSHVYYATVGIHTQYFDQWRLQDCIDFIDYETREIATMIDLLSPPSGATYKPDENFWIEGILYEKDTTNDIENQPIDIYQNGTLLTTLNTDNTGHFAYQHSIPSAGTYTIKTEFQGTGGYVASEAHANVYRAH